MAYAVVIGAATGTLVALVVPLAVDALDTPPPPSGSSRSSSSSGGQVPSDTVALVSGLVYSTLAVGVSTGPILAGWLFDVTGSYASGFRASAVFCFAAAMASCGLLVKDEKGVVGMP
jgi:MFS family permease